MINAEAINTVDPGGEAARRLMWRGSTVNFYFCCEKMIASVDPGGGLTPPRHSMR